MCDLWTKLGISHCAGQCIERMGLRGAMLLSITLTIDTKTGVCLPMNMWSIMHNGRYIVIRCTQQVNSVFSQDKHRCITNSRLMLNRAYLGPGPV